jgi:hypothetical protein
MADLADLLTYAHENRKFVLVRMIAPAVVVSLFLVAFIYGVEWQGHDTAACAAGQAACHSVTTTHNAGS